MLKCPLLSGQVHLCPEDEAIAALGNVAEALSSAQARFSLSKPSQSSPRDVPCRTVAAPGMACHPVIASHAGLRGRTMSGSLLHVPQGALRCKLADMKAERDCLASEMALLRRRLAAVDAAGCNAADPGGGPDTCGEGPELGPASQRELSG